MYGLSNHKSEVHNKKFIMSFDTSGQRYEFFPQFSTDEIHKILIK